MEPQGLVNRGHMATSTWFAEWTRLNIRNGIQVIARRLWYPFASPEQPLSKKSVACQLPRVLDMEPGGMLLPHPRCPSSS
jgi:hypothetical protein